MHIFFLIWTIVVLYGVIVVDLLKKNSKSSEKSLNKDVDTPSTFLFSQLKWMPFPERVIYQKAIQMYKTLSGTSTNYH